VIEADGMNDIPVSAAMGWRSSSSSSGRRARTRLRDVLPPIAAILVLTLAHFAYGAVQPVAALPLAGVFTIIAALALLGAGPHHVTLGMLIGAVVIAVMGVTGLAGPLDRAAPELAVLFAAGCLWVVGYIAARHRSALDAAWHTMIWSGIFYCVVMFAMHVSGAPTGDNAMRAAFETPANAAILFGLLAIVGMGRILHVVKQMDAEALAHARMLDRLLRSGLGGILLVVMALTCLSMTGSRPGILITCAILIGHVWWDLLAITSRDHRGALARLASIAAPFIALALLAWGVSDAWINDDTVTPGVGAAQQLPNIQRVEAYMGAWMERPAIGHGLGSVEIAGAKSTTLFNAKAMLAHGGAHNVFVTWLVELGIVGLALLVFTIAAMHARIFAALTSRRTPRTFLRLALMSGLLMLVHGVTDSSLDLPSAVWLYAFLLGAACGLATGQRSKAREDAE
jgi:O-antigen ligase